MPERNRVDPFQDQSRLPDPDEGVIPDLDMQFGDDPEISGGDDLAKMDEENLYGSDVIVEGEAEDCPPRLDKDRFRPREPDREIPPETGQSDS